MRRPQLRAIPEVLTVFAVPRALALPTRTAFGARPRHESLGSYPGLRPSHLRRVLAAEPPRLATIHRRVWPESRSTDGGDGRPHVRRYSDRSFDRFTRGLSIIRESAQAFSQARLISVEQDRVTMPFECSES